ncbi:MAG: transketolase [Elusimicrobiota bacterium]|jgi:transketolase
MRSKMPERRGRAELKDLRAMASQMRRWIVERAFSARIGHIGSALCIADIVAVLWGAVMRRPGTSDHDRDRFILGKGHAVLAQYAAMRWLGLMEDDYFRTYCHDGSLLGVHPEHLVPGVEVSTGSLGQGLSVGCGIALAQRMKKSPGRVFVLISDAECNEGQVWEAAQFAAHHRLSSLVVVVDENGLQAMGDTKGILDLSPLVARWRAFGWQALETDGHDPAALLRALRTRPGSKPRIVVARTVMGKGVSFMEGKVEWHYRTLSPELAAKALKELSPQP